jgi:hypothetical protein
MVYNQEANDPMKAEDVAKVDGDDPYDTLRYLLKAVDRYVLRVQKEAERRAELQHILIEHGKNQDATHFYMEMDAYDKRNSRANASVSRYRQKFN